MTPAHHDQTTLSLADEEKAEIKKLVLAFKAGDAAVYNDIYERYSARVNNICRRMLTDPHDAQEASQEAFLRVYQALGRFNGRYELGAWIARIATNVCLDNLRSRNRRPQSVAPIEAIDLEVDHEAPDTPESVTIRRAESRRVRKVLLALPPMHRAAIVLRDFEGLSYGEIAGALQITETQVKALLHRARQRFKRDWSALASIFLPFRLLQRFKAVPPQGVEQAAAYGTTTSPQLMTTCSVIVQNCGQFLAERVGPAIVALGVVATGGAVAATHEPTQVELKPVHSAIEAAKPPAGAAVKKDLKPRHTDKKVKEKVEETVVPVPVTSPSPEESPSMDSEPTNEQEVPQEDDHSHEPANGGVAPASPPPFSPALGFGTPRSAPARSNLASVNCDTMSVNQELNAYVAHGDDMLLARLELDADQKDVDFDLEVYPDQERGEMGGDVDYSGEGTLTSATGSGSRLQLEYSGYYQNTDNDAQWKELPEEGTFHISVELDCTASSVITETLQLASE